MKLKLSQIIKSITPPIVLGLLLKVIKSHGRIQFKGRYRTWADASKYAIGYDDETILKKVLSATLKVKNGESAFERDSVLFDAIEYSWPVTAGLMRVAALNGGCLSVLDFGGSLGSCYFQNREFLTGLKRVKWSVIEQSHFVQAGQAYIGDSQLVFYDNIQKSVDDSQPNVVLLSGVLQYLPDPWAIFEQLLALEADLVIVDRTPFLAQGSSEIIKLQIITNAIYPARYPLHYFLKNDFLKRSAAYGYRVISEFNAVDRMEPDAPWQGFLLCKKGI